MSSTIAVKLISIEVTRNFVVLNLKDGRGQHRIKSFPRADFELVTRPLAAGQPNALIKLGFRLEGPDRSLVARLDDGTLANMGNSTQRNRGVALDLISMIAADKQGQGSLLSAIAKGSPLTVPNPFRDK